MDAWSIWVVLVVAGMAGVAVYLAAAAVVGSHLLVHPVRCTSGTTPAAYGWAYEPMGEDLVTDDGVSLRGWWIPAAAPIGASGPTIVLVHGYADNKSGMLRYARHVHPEWNVVVFDLRASGESGGRHTTQGLNERRDLVAVIDWLERYKHPRTIVVFGQSMGGETALLAAAADQRIDAVIADSTHDRLRTPVLSAMRNHHLPLAAAAFPLIMFGAYLRTGLRFTAGDPLDHVRALGQRPLLILHGTADVLDPPACAERLAATATVAGVPVELRLCAGAGHGHTDELTPTAYRRWLTGFLARLTDRRPVAGRVASAGAVAPLIPGVLPELASQRLGYHPAEGGPTPRRKSLDSRTVAPSANS